VFEIQIWSSNLPLTLRTIPVNYNSQNVRTILILEVLQGDLTHMSAGRVSDFSPNVFQFFLASIELNKTHVSSRVGFSFAWFFLENLRLRLVETEPSLGLGPKHPVWAGMNYRTYIGKWVMCLGVCVCGYIDPAPAAATQREFVYSFDIIWESAQSSQVPKKVGNFGPCYHNMRECTELPSSQEGGEFWAMYHVLGVGVTSYEYSIPARQRERETERERDCLRQFWGTHIISNLNTENK
jgi:hypothetical protein